MKEIAQYFGVTLAHLKGAMRSMVRQAIIYNDNWNKQRLNTTYKAGMIARRVNTHCHGIFDKDLTAANFTDWFESTINSEKEELKAYQHKH